MSIGERILKLRKENKFSQCDLASALDISRQAVSKWESDKSCPDTFNLIQLSEILNTTVEYLATGRSLPSRPAPVQVNYINRPERIIEKPVEVEKIVEVEKPVIVEKVVEKIVEKPVEKPVLRRVVRFRYRTNPITVFICIGIGFLIGLITGLSF